MPRIVPPISLSEEERVRLATMSRSHSLDHRFVVRATVILFWSDGVSIAETARRIGLSANACAKWRKRFASTRLKGLEDEARSGRPPTISPETRVRVLDAARSKPPGKRTAWTQRMIAMKCGVSQTTVFETLQEADLKPHRVEYWCGRPTDPDFESKMTDIVGLYLNPPENAIVISVDAKTQIQALDRTQPVLPMREGAAKRLTNTYTRHGTVSLLAALSVHTGTVDARTVERTTSSEFVSFLKYLYRCHPGKHLHVIVDNHSVNKSQEVAAWLKRKRRITLHFTPTYASWLNQVEIWFSILSRQMLRGAVWTSKEQLARDLMAYVRDYSQGNPKPFRWTYTGKPCTA